MSDFRNRKLLPRITSLLGIFPVVLLVGARQVGKSTIARRLIAQGRFRSFVTMDDALTIEEAQRDPAGFVAQLDLPVVIDEIQRVPSLLLAIKAHVDNKRVNGSFLLTGSANVLLLPKVADSLAGRMSIVTVWPFAQCELEESEGTFVDTLFSENPAWRLGDSDQLSEHIVRGGYPASCMAETESERKELLGSLVTTVLGRDLRDIMQVDDIFQFQRLLRILCTRPASLLNTATLSRDIGIARPTLQRYLHVLDMAYLTFRLPSWSTNAAARESKAPKSYIVDTGLACYEARLTRQRLEEDPYAFGMMLENFVVSEILRQQGWNETDFNAFHYRSHDGRREVDLLLEERGGNCAAVEIKSGQMVRREDIAGMEFLRETLGARFIRGVVLYQGTNRIPMGDRIEALPLSALRLQ